MGKPNYVGANRGDIQYIPPPSSAMSDSPTTGYAQPAQYVGRDQIHTIDPAGDPAPNYEKGYEKGSFHQVETFNSNASFVKEERPEKRPNIIVRLFRHWRRHWILYGILFILFLAILLPLFFLVAFPAIAQLMVNKADLPIYDAQIMDPTPQTIVFSMNGSLNVPKPFSVHMPPTTLSLFIDEGLPDITPYAEVGLFYPDGQTLKGNATVSISDQKADIKDPGEFVRFLESAVYNEKFFLSCKGKTTASVGKLKAKLKINKKVQLNGLNMLKGFAITSARVVLPPEADGTNFIGNITLPNASDVTFQMGNVTLNLKVAGLIIGHATILDVFLVPGNNSVVAKGTASIRTLIANLPQILAAEAQAISKGNIELQASGNTTVYKGQEIYYFNDVLNKLELSAQMPILKLLIDSAGGILGDVTGGGGIGGLLGALGGTGNSSGNGSAIENLTNAIKGLNITDLTGLLLGPESADNSNGNSSLLGLLGKLATRVPATFQRRNTLPTRLDIPVTMHKRSDAIARRKAAAESQAAAGPHTHCVAKKVKRFAQGNNYADIVSLLKSEKSNIASWIGEAFESPQASSIADTVLDALLAGQKAKRARMVERADYVEAVGVPLRRRQNIKPVSDDAVVAAILAKDRSIKRTTPPPALQRLAFLRGVARSGIVAIAGNGAAADVLPYKRKRTTKSGRGIVESILSKREALNRFGSVVRSAGLTGITNLKTRELNVDTSALALIARRAEDAKRGQVGQRAEAPILIHGKRFLPAELLGRFGNVIRGFAKNGINTVVGNAVAAASTPPPLHKRRNQKSHREVVAAILSKREALDRFGAVVRSTGLQGIHNLKTRSLNLDTSKLQAVKDSAKRREDAARAKLDTRSDAPVVVKGRAFAKGELLGRFALTVRSFAKRGLDVVQGRGVVAENLRTPRIEDDGTQVETPDDDADDLEVEDEDSIAPLEELPNPLAAFGTINSLLQARNTATLLSSVARLLAASRGLSTRDLDTGNGGNGGAEAAAAVALGLTEVHKVMPLLRTNQRALEVFGRLTRDGDVREKWRELAESEEAGEIWRVFVRGRELAKGKSGAGGEAW